MLFYEKGLKFSCTQCSHCCRHESGFVYLSKIDLTNLCECFTLKEKDFIKKYCRIVEYYSNMQVLCLKEKANFDCILWDNGCTAYTARPTQCSTYPFWSFLLKDKKAWDDEATECPGINQGKNHSKSEIIIQMQAYEANKPLTVEECKAKGFI